VGPAFRYIGASTTNPNQVLPAELSAAAVLIDYWNKEINNAVWITMCLIVVIFINALGAGAYGEAEFIFASIKVRAISFLLVSASTHMLY
jgi:yeast amino acid transporter